MGPVETKTVNGSKEQFIPRSQRRKMEKLQEEASSLYDLCRNQFIKYLTNEVDLTEELIEARIHLCHVKWKTFCTTKGFGSNVYGVVKEQLENIYKVYKQNLNDYGKEETSNEQGS